MQFQQFCGLKSNQPVFKNGRIGRAPTPEDEIYSDEEDMVTADDGGVPYTKPDGTVPDDQDLEEPEPEHPQEAYIEDVLEPEVIEKSAPEKRMDSFLEDPENAMKVFLSSYLDEKGLLW